MIYRASRHDELKFFQTVKPGTDLGGSLYRSSLLLNFKKE